MRYRRLTLLLPLAVLVAGGWLVAKSVPAVAHWRAGNGSSQSAAGGAQAAPVDTTALQAKLEQTIADYSGLDISISLTDLSSGREYHYGETASFAAASVSKLLTASLYLHQVEQGQRSLDDAVADATAAQQLEKLIVDSDNAAWTALNAELIQERLQSYAQAEGLSSYEATTNTLTSDDVAHLLGKLYRNQLLNTSHTKLLMSYMARASQRDYIVAAAPSQAQVYHKAGWLDDRLHDAAIIDDGHHAYALVIFTKSYSQSYDYQAARGLFGGITRAASETFLSSR
jgi:beta-lactamase class A